MTLAIHKSTQGFHPRWIAYCKENNIPYKTVNCYDNNIVEQLKECQALLWHHHQMDPRDLVIAKQILFALSHIDFKVFPDFKTGWHFDDKVAQKYLFEVINAPMVTSYAFYEKTKALEWVNTTNFPKVFKLRGGAGSSNVKLIKNRNEAQKTIKQAFGKGFSNYDALVSFKERWRKYKLGKATIWEPIKGLLRVFKAPQFAKVMGKELGYVYFQDFIINLNCDYRLIVIDKKTLGIKRYTRDNDFRASGSGKLSYDHSLFPTEMLKLANELANKLQLQSAAFDFVIDNKEIKVIEVSYGFPAENFADDCPGYWDEHLKWREGKFNPYGWIVEGILKDINE